MSIDKDYLYEGLLSYNFFPMVKEKKDDLPPIFSTDTFSPAVADKLLQQQAGLPALDRKARDKDGFDQVEYRTTRFNNVIRLMHIPHPAPFARLCASLRDNWDHIKFICQNPISQIKPQRHQDGRILTVDDYGGTATGRVVVMEKDRFPVDVQTQLDMAFGARYFVEADVSSCFASIYTHAVPWALVGHTQAKQNRGNGEWFNKLDWCQRHLKRGETQGVPVGPATSNIVNEIVLARIDEALAKAGYKFVRFIDDFKCYCESRDEAEQFLRDLEGELSKYLLSLNAKKVAILELPLSTRNEWVTSLASRLPEARTVNPRQVLNFLDAATAIQKEYPGGSVVKYAARSLLGKLSDETAPLYVQYLAQTAMHFPIVLPMICEAVRKYDCVIAAERLSPLLERQITYRRSDSMCWTIYLFALSQQVVPDALVQTIADGGDCMAMAALLATGHSTDKVVERVTLLAGCHFYEMDKSWVTIHELALRGELTDASLLQYVEQSGLQTLIDESVTFLRDAALAEEPDADEPVNGDDGTDDVMPI